MEVPGRAEQLGFSQPQAEGLWNAEEFQDFGKKMGFGFGTSFSIHKVPD